MLKINKQENNNDNNMMKKIMQHQQPEAAMKTNESILDKLLFNNKNEQKTQQNVLLNLLNNNNSNKTNTPTTARITRNKTSMLTAQELENEQINKLPTIAALSASTLEAALTRNESIMQYKHKNLIEQLFNKSKTSPVNNENKTTTKFPLNTPQENPFQHLLGQKTSSNDSTAAAAGFVIGKYNENTLNQTINNALNQILKSSSSSSASSSSAVSSSGSVSTSPTTSTSPQSKLDSNKNTFENLLNKLKPQPNQQQQQKSNNNDEHFNLLLNKLTKINTQSVNVNDVPSSSSSSSQPSILKWFTQQPNNNRTTQPSVKLPDNCVALSLKDIENY